MIHSARPRRLLRVEVSNRCNLDCVFCCWRAHPGAAEAGWRLLAPREYRILTQAAVASGCRRIMLTGGEPLLVPIDTLLPVITAMAEVEGLEDFWLTTNGTGLQDPELCRKLRRAGLRKVVVSIGGADEAAYRTYSRSSATLAAALEGVRQAAAAGLTVKVDVPLSTAGVRAVGQLLELLSRVADAGATQAAYFRLHQTRENAGVYRELLVEPEPLTRALSQRQDWRLECVDGQHCFVKGPLTVIVPARIEPVTGFCNRQHCGDYCQGTYAAYLIHHTDGPSVRACHHAFHDRRNELVIPRADPASPDEALLVDLFCRVWQFAYEGPRAHLEHPNMSAPLTDSEAGLVIDCITAELNLLNTLPERVGAVKLDLLPHYLRHPEQQQYRETLVRTLRRLVGLLLRQIVRDCTPPPDLSLVIAAMLYAEQRREPFFEQPAVENLPERLREDRALRLWKSLRLDANVEDIQGLVMLHKQATLVYGGRLPQGTFSGVPERLRPTLGLLAASCFDAPGHHTRKDYNDYVEGVLGPWVKSSYAEELIAPRSVLWDLPLCVPESESLRRRYDRSAILRLSHFIQSTGLAAQLAEEEFLSYHYLQSIMQTCLPTGHGFGPFPDLDPCEADYAYRRIWEIRFKKEYALRWAIGLAPGGGIGQGCDTACQHMLPCELRDESAWSAFIDKLTDGTCANRLNDKEEGYYPLPLREYLPLPLLVRLFEMSKEYSESVISQRRLPNGEHPAPLKAFVRVQYTMDGQRDLGFPGHVVVWVPQRPGETATPVVRTAVRSLEKLLAATATNLGVCAGYDHIVTTSEGERDGVESWLECLHQLLAQDNAGYELLLRYVEGYMRSHDVSLIPGVDPRVYREVFKDLKRLDQYEILQGDSSSAPRYCVGIDIGATTMKLALYENPGNLAVDRRVIGTYRQGLPKKRGSQERYTGMREFCDRLAEGVDQVLTAGDTTLDRVDAIGICWPGLTRDDRIAGAGGIFKYFDEESVASRKVKENAVDKMRRLDVVADFRAALEARFPQVGLPHVSVCNDGTAEALGRSLSESAFRAHRWAVLKLGTGTAGAVLDEGVLREGPMEFGKLVLNVLRRSPRDAGEVVLRECRESDHGQEARGPFGPTDRMPEGLLNEFASQALFPLVHRGMRSADSTEPLPSSFELGTLGAFYLDPNAAEEPSRDVYERIGLEHLYRQTFETTCSKGELETLIGANGDPDARIISSILDALGLEARELQPAERDLTVERSALGTLLKASAERIGRKRCDSIFADIGPARAARQHWFKELFDRAGAILADATMLIHGYYRLNGIILCGGVLSEPAVARRVFRSVELHLRRRYFTRFATLDDYLDDLREKRVGKRSFTTIYHHWPKACLENNGLEPPADCGEIGALYHAKAVAAAGLSDKDLTEEVLVVEREQLEPRRTITEDDRIAVVVVALSDPRHPGRVRLLQRAFRERQGGQYLFLSGKMTKGDTDSLGDASVATTTVMREVREETGIKLERNRIRVLGYYDQGGSFRFFLCRAVLPVGVQCRFNFSIRGSAVVVPKLVRGSDASAMRGGGGQVAECRVKPDEIGMTLAWPGTPRDGGAGANDELAGASPSIGIEIAVAAEGSPTKDSAEGRWLEDSMGLADNVFKVMMYQLACENSRKVGAE